MSIIKWPIWNAKLRVISKNQPKRKKDIRNNILERTLFGFDSSPRMNG
jgi:hypothetical protein